jgi:RNA polymerase sigma factor (sigma-70 family)
MANLRYGLEDCFQMAIVEVPKILNAFSPSPIASLKTYSRVAFSNILRDALRQHREIDICSDWSLLLKISRKRLQTSLQNIGLSRDTIVEYLRAWACFESAYRSQKSNEVRQRKAPDRSFWQQVSALYNSDNVNHPNQTVTPEKIEKWLTTTAKQVRSDLYPNVTSLNLPRSNQMTGTVREIQDELPSAAPESLLDGLILKEEQDDRRSQQQQINQILMTAITQHHEKELLDLYYHQQLTQQQIAQQLNVQQYTVSRRLTKARTELLKILSQWSQETLHISPTSNVLKDISAVLEEWLLEYYRSLKG